MATLNIDYQLRQGSGATGEPVRTNTWEIEIPALGPVHLFAQKVKLPGMTIEQLKIRHFNAETKIAGKAEFEDVQITIRDVVDPDMFALIQAWQKRVFDVQSKSLGFASDYKEMGFAYIYDSTGGDVRSYTLQGLWPKKFTPGDRNYDDAKGVEIELELSCDYFIVGQLVSR
jgi:hypothetical protein